MPIQPIPDARPGVGDTAPDLTLMDSQGRTVTLSRFWSEKPTLLLFLRHFG